MASPDVLPPGPDGLGRAAVITWVVAAVAALGFPWLFPVLVLVIVYPLVRAIPFVDRATLRKLLVGGMAALALAGVFALSNDDGGLIDDIEDEAELVIVIVGLVGMGALIAETIRRTNAAHRDVAMTAMALSEQVTESRRRLVRTADAERARLERDLHDGAQQQLVALGIDLRRITSKAARGDEGVDAELAAAVTALDDAIAEVRSLAHGIYPPLLEVRGLPDALAAACRRSANHVEPILSDVGRFGREVEAAVYFCAVEALANADKHAPGATVELELDRIADELVLSVANDGSLSADAELGRGVTNMRDRIEALGGTFRFGSKSDGSGIVVNASIPVDGVGG